MKNNITQLKTRAACAVTVLIVMVLNLSIVNSVRAANQTWTGGSATDNNWSDAGNWGGFLPAAGDALFFDGSTRPAPVNDFAAGTAFNGIVFNPGASAFTISGNSVLLSGQVFGNTNGIVNNSPVAQTVNLNLTNDWGYHKFYSSAGGPLALNGTLVNNLGGLACFDTNVTSTSLTTDGSGLISGLGGAGFMLNGDGNYYGLATINAGSMTDYVYAAGNVYSAAGPITSGSNNNVQLNPTANTTYTIGSGTALNTVLNMSGASTATLTITGTLTMGPVGGFYVADGLSSAGGAANGTKNLITLNGAGSFVTAGGTTPGTPGTLVFAVNGTGTGNSMAVNPTSITNNGAGGTVTVVKAGSGSMYFQSVNGYSGGTYIDQGYLQGNQATATNGFSSFGSGPVYVAAGATVFPNAGTGTWTNSFFLSPGLGYPNNLGSIKSQGATYTGPITLQGMATTNAGAGDRISCGANAGTVTLAGPIAGTGTLELSAQAATVNWLLRNTNAVNPANSWAGGVIVGNTANNNCDLKLGANEQIPNGSSAGDVTLFQSGGGFARLDLNGFNETINGLNSSDSGSTLNQVGNFAAGTPTLTLGDNNATASFDGVIGGGNNINIIKIGTGTQTLANANTYTGNTTISKGVLALSGSGNLGATTILVAGGGVFDVSQLGTFTMSSGQTLSGGGVVTGSVVTVSGSIISPGGATTLNFANDLALNTGSISVFNLSDATNGANDHITVAGNLALNGGTIKINAATLQLGRYKLIAYGGTESGVAANLTPFYSGSQIVSLDDSIPGELDLVVEPGVVPNLLWVGDSSANMWDTTSLNWLNGATPAAFANGNMVHFTDSGSKSPAVNLATTVQPVSLLVSNNTGIYTFSGSGNISGGASLNKQGAGTLVLNESGVDNFIGGILVGGGTLVLSNTTMNISGGIVVSGGTLMNGDNGTIGGNLAASSANVSITGSGTLNGNIFSTNSTMLVIGTGTISGSINNFGGSTTISNGPNISGDVTMTGGTVLLDQTTTPSGNAIINSGVLQVGNNDANGNPPAGTITDNGSLVFNRNDAALILTSIISGSGSVMVNGSGTVQFGNGVAGTSVESYTGPTVVTNGTLALQGPNAAASTISSSSSLTINNNGIVQLNSDNSLGNPNPGGLPIIINAGGTLTGLGSAGGGTGTSSHIRGLLTLNGGNLAMNGSQTATHGSWDLDGGVVVPAGPFTSVISALNVVPSQTGGTIINVARGTDPSGIDLLVSGTFNNASAQADTGFIKTGNGVMALNGDNTYSHGTIISNGTLQVNGSVVAGTGLTVAPAGTLAGTGTIGDTVTVNGTIAPGLPAAIGTLTCSSTVTLNGTTAMKLNKTAQTNDVLSVGGGLVYGGTLNVTNLSGTLTATDTFQLFSTPGTGAFTSIVPATPGTGLAWDTSTLTADGILRILVSTVNTDPATANFRATASSGSLQFTWAPDHLGWQLYTNAAGLNTSGNWFPVPGSASVTNETITINPANPNVFFQLRYP